MQFAGRGAELCILATRVRWPAFGARPHAATGAASLRSDWRFATEFFWPGSRAHVRCGTAALRRAAHQRRRRELAQTVWLVACRDWPAEARVDAAASVSATRGDFAGHHAGDAAADI